MSHEDVARMAMELCGQLAAEIGVQLSAYERITTKYSEVHGTGVDNRMDVLQTSEGSNIQDAVLCLALPAPYHRANGVTTQPLVRGEIHHELCLWRL